MLTRLLCILLLFPAVPAAAKSTPRSIILIIGDGMGPAQFTAALLLRGEESRLPTMPVTGLLMTQCADSIAPDSAASATALASGVITKYRYLGVDADGKSVRTVLEVAEATGRSTALVTTANFWDATSAAFASHTASRYETANIIDQMLRRGIEIIIGGGSTTLGTEKIPSLKAIAERYGYATEESLSGLNRRNSTRLLGVFPTQKYEVDFPGARLPDLASWALERVASDKDGFFVMLEHEGTDGSAHQNATAAFEASVRSFDETVNVALAFASTRPDVLVVVTGDHDTGGLQIAPEKIGAPLQLQWAAQSHTGEMVPIFAKGPGAEWFGGLMHNSEVGKRLIELVEGPQSERKATITLRP